MADAMLLSDKRPWAFYVCAITFSFERMAYYSAKFLVFVFIAATIVTGGLGLDGAIGAQMQSYLVAFTYLAPIFGGYLADRYLSPKLCVSIGLILMGVGYSVGYFANGIGLLWVMIILVSIGTGFFKSNLTAIIGRLFPDQKRLDSAFSTYYSFVNIGSLIGTTVIGILYLNTFARGDVLGFRPCFLLCGIVMFVAAAWFIIGSKSLGEVGKKPFKANQKFGVAEVADENKAKEPLTSVQKKRMAAIVLISFYSIIFWLFWYLAYLPIYDHWETNANWLVGSFLVPVVWFDSLNALACIALGPVLGILWFRLSRRPQGDMSLFKKVAIGLFLMGAAYLIFALAEATRGTGQASLLYIIVFCLLLSLGEMFFSPLGNSFVSKYAPPRYLSVMMGVWIFAVFIASLSYGHLYSFILPLIEGGSYAMVNVVIAIIAAVAAVVLLVLNKPLTRLIEEEPKA